MVKLAWAPFRHDATAFRYPGDALHAAWPRLHGGDCEPWPDARRAAHLLAAAGHAAPHGLRPATLAAVLQDAWRAFHRGDFKDAFESGSRLGVVGATVAVKALGVHATHLVVNEGQRRDRFAQAIAIADDAHAVLPGEVNSHYLLAFALGRHAQTLTLAQALKLGIGGRLRQALDVTVRRLPAHAEAHTALALFHAEIVAKLGAMIANLSYGAKAAAAEFHIGVALERTPYSPVTHIEHGNVLQLLHGGRHAAAASEAYRRAARCEPADAMEVLDVAHARAQLP